MLSNLLFYLSSEKAKKKILLALKVIAFCLVVSLAQTSLFADTYFADVQIDLVFATLLVFISRLGLFEVIVASLFFAVFTSMLLYDNALYWFYPIVAVLAHKINPDQIADKFLVCILFTIFLTPLYELLNLRDIPYIDRVISGVIVNILLIVPIYVLVKLFFEKRRL